jgi:hypothetical protein
MKLIAVNNRLIRPFNSGKADYLKSDTGSNLCVALA